jgi:hypothetical protein
MKCENLSDESKCCDELQDKTALHLKQLGTVDLPINMIPIK